MTPAMRKALAALAGSDIGCLSYSDLRLACGTTWRGWHAVRHRLVDTGLAEHAPDNGKPRLSITDAGRKAATTVEGRSNG